MLDALKTLKCSRKKNILKTKIFKNHKINISYSDKKVHERYNML